MIRTPPQSSRDTASSRTDGRTRRQAPWRRRPCHRGMCWAVILAFILAGCDSSDAVRSKHSSGSAALSNAPGSLKRDHFALAMDNLAQRDAHNLDRAASQAAYHLNHWASEQTADPRWMVDRRMINTLPLAIRQAPATKELASDQELSQLSFQTGDVMYLEQMRWLHSVALRVTDRELDGELDEWIRTQEASPAAARQLEQGMQLFDWVIRNIQLDELLPYPQSTTAGPLTGTEARDPTVSWPPPMRGVPGPGYRQFPWHSMIYGHGDMLERARVFLLLGRQLHLDIVMLGIDQKTGRARPWLPALMIGQKLYLFDTELGLPIPAADDRGIVTLEQMQADRSRLDQLSVGESLKYRVEKSDLDNVVALIDASPQAMSQRMRIVESHLDAAHELVLSVSVPRLRKAVTSCAGISDARLWAVPIEADMYQQVRDVQMSNNPQMQWDEFLEHGIFQGLGSLARARRQHLLGHIERTDDLTGATQLYLLSRTPDIQIEAMAQSPDAQAASGLSRPEGVSDQAWEQRVAQEVRLRKQAKLCASYWLGILHYENDEFDVAASWLKKRTLDADPAGKWVPGARYNLARCYEALGKHDEASRLLLIDQSPQRLGNLLRARRLNARAEAEPETEKD